MAAKRQPAVVRPRFGDALARGLAFRSRVSDGVRRGEFRSFDEGVERLRSRVYGMRKGL